jgi:hypothetical protein
MVLDAFRDFPDRHECCIYENEGSYEEIHTPPNKMAMHFVKAVFVRVATALQTSPVAYVDYEQP